MRTYTIGTRGSDLAMWQAHFLQEQLAAIGVVTDLQIISTKGDRIQDMSFDKIEGKGFFTKEIEDALLCDEVDIAVHSMKDLPTSQVEGLVLGATSYREDPRDIILIREDVADAGRILHLKEGAVVGTSSARRKAQMLHLTRDIQIQDIRGNVPTRIQKLRDGAFDAILLAKAGIDRLKLDLEGLKAIPLHPKEFVPAPAQGVLAFQCRTDDINVRKILASIHQPEVAHLTNVERRVLQMMEGGCHIPLGVHVYRDAMGSYHGLGAYATAWDAPLTKAACSLSTYQGMADILFNQLKEKV